MILEREELLDALNAVMPGIDKKDIIEQMTHFQFTGDNLVAYNDAIHIKYPFKTDFICSAPAKPLHKLISSLKGERVSLKKVKGTLKIKSKETDSELNIVVENDIDHILTKIEEDLAKQKYKPIPADFTEAAHLCSFSAAKDETQGTLTCVHIKGTTIEAGDRTRCSRYVMEKKMPEFLIRASVPNELVKYNVTRYAVSESWVHFKTEEGAFFSCRRVKGDYLDYDKFFDDFKGVKVVLPEKLAEALNTLLAFSDEGWMVQPYTEIIFKKDKLVCKVQSNVGKSTRQMKLDYNKKERSIRINPYLLKQVLDKANTIFIGSRMAMFKHDKFKHIIALMT
jgi:hypothetical protein